MDQENIKMEIKDFISATEYDRSKPILEFSDFYIKSHASDILIIREGVKNGTIALITGKGFSVEYETPHDCDCQHCEKTTDHIKFFLNKEDAEKFLEKIQKKYDPDYWDSEIDDNVYFIKAVKQNYENLGELFNG